MSRQSHPSRTIKGSRILIIDDEADMLTNYRRLLQRTGHECLTLPEVGDLERHLNEFQPDVVVTDLMMPKDSGMDVLERVQTHDPTLPVMIITAHGSVQNAVEAMKHHAADYMEKPFQVEELLKKIQELSSRRLIDRSASTGHKAPARGNEDPAKEVIGVNPAIKRVIDLAHKVARTDVNVLILGESGTGKEVVARLIHRLSQRRDQPFVPVDCSSFPENLLESELFGYRKGAFTGANSDKMGLFEFADRGTLFLDEIGEMPLNLQAKLLRLLQERKFRPIGAHEQRDADVRVLAATNMDLEEALRQKTFRSDLYYRLNVVTVHLPPLRERREDIPLLARHFLRRFVADNQLNVNDLAPEVLEALSAYDWPGNVRELQNVIEHAATFASAVRIECRDLPENLQARSCEGATSEAEAELFRKRDQVLGDFERDYLIALLNENDFNVSKAAQQAGCNRRTLYRMIHRHQLNLEQLRHQP